MEDDLTIADLRIEPDADSLLPGSKLHWYRIDSVLGQGDYWFTYLASDLNLTRPVIITEYMPCEIVIRDTRGVIHPAAAEHGAEYKAGLECFLTDAQKLAGIRHQNIAQALNVFEANNSAYIVVAHQQGEKAEHLFDGSTVAEKELLAFVLPILDGLEAIHASGYIHRYIQPSNIIIRPDGSPVLTGFNPGGGALFNPANTLAKHFPSDYAPIELCLGDGELHGPWTDIFSLGATLYQAVVGVAPVDAIERSRMVVQGGTDPLMSVLPVGQGNYSDAFLNAIDHALGFLPTQRPLTVAAWRNELSGKDSLGVAIVIRPESEQVAKLRADLETHKLRAEEDHKRRAAERSNEEARTLKKLLDLARTAINTHDLQTAQTRLDEAAGIAPKSEAVAGLREELKARETVVAQQRLVAETRHQQAEETANTLVALGRKALQANDIKMAEAHLDQAFAIRPESEQVAKLRADLETHKLRAEEDHKRRAAERSNEEARTL
ncbi:MAG: serine/threonine protein kinase, partial [Gammaproteobacteria bacterium]